MQMLPWIAVLAVVFVAVAVLGFFMLRPRKVAPPAPLPTEWALTARPVFSTDERRVFAITHLQNRRISNCRAPG